MGYTSSEVKNRWNKKHYDVISSRLPKGCREEINLLARNHGMSTAQFIRWAILQAVSEAEREQCPHLTGHTAETIENGYVSPFPHPPRRTERLINLFLGGV